MKNRAIWPDDDFKRRYAAWVQQREEERIAARRLKWRQQRRPYSADRTTKPETEYDLRLNRWRDAEALRYRSEEQVKKLNARVAALEEQITKATIRLRKRRFIEEQRRREYQQIAARVEAAKAPLKKSAAR